MSSLTYSPVIQSLVQSNICLNFVLCQLVPGCELMVTLRGVFQSRIIKPDNCKNNCTTDHTVALGAPDLHL